MTETSLSYWISSQAASLGFALCGVVSAKKFPELARTEEWLACGYAGEMKYLHDARRSDPATAMPGVRSVIVCALNYNAAYPRTLQAMAQPTASQAEPVSDAAPGHADTAGADDEPRGWISRYAWGTDYHLVLREKLELLLAALRGRCGEDFGARTHADTGPVQERILAKYAGLGWLGKNTLLLNQQIGSFFFLGVILTTLDIAPTLKEAAGAPRDLCGTCRRCLDACPTQAFVAPYVMDARRCISYLTIELRGSIPEEFRAPIGAHVFGCDICQDVCPWNRRAPITQAEQFQPRTFAPSGGAATSGNPHNGRNGDAVQGHSLYLPELEWLASMSEGEFRQVFRNSPIQRTKWRGLVRNACIALGNARLTPDSAAKARIVAILRGLTNSADIPVAASAQWALARIQSQEQKSGPDSNAG
jgi:epoxyqueuosine reductase